MRCSGKKSHSILGNVGQLFGARGAHLDHGLRELPVSTLPFLRMPVFGTVVVSVSEAARGGVARGEGVLRLRGKMVSASIGPAPDGLHPNILDTKHFNLELHGIDALDDTDADSARARPRPARACAFRGAQAQASRGAARPVTDRAPRALHARGSIVAASLRGLGIFHERHCAPLTGSSLRSILALSFALAPHPRKRQREHSDRSDAAGATAQMVSPAPQGLRRALVAQISSGRCAASVSVDTVPGRRQRPDRLRPRRDALRSIKICCSSPRSSTPTPAMATAGVNSTDGRSGWHLGASVGPAFDLTQSVRFDLSAEIGFHQLQESISTASSAYSTSATLPYFGIRPAISVQLGQGKFSGAIGAAFYFRLDAGPAPARMDSPDDGGHQLGVEAFLTLRISLLNGN